MQNILSICGKPIVEVPLSDLFLIRPVEMTDAPALLELVKQSSGGLSSLQPRLDYLKAYIDSAVKSFSGDMPTEYPHKYLLAMTDYTSGQLIGCAAVKTCVGADSPFINFDLKGDGLDQYLEASSRFLGATEVGSLFLHKDFRAGGLGRYLAKVRYLLMAAEPWRFGDIVIAELRGICGADGSPLYDYLFRDRLEKTFLEADKEYFDRNPDALGEIVPIGQIPTARMPRDVRASLAQPHPTGMGAMRLLLNEGFIFSGTIDLFDGGPIMSAYQDTIRTGLQSQIAPVQIGTSEFTKQILVSTGDVANFRAVVTPGRDTGMKAELPKKALEALSIKSGDPVRYWHRGLARKDI